MADAAVVHDELVEADRQQIAGEVADGAVEILAAERRGQLDHADHEPRVGQADANVAPELVLGEERLELDREILGVDHLSVDHEADRQRVDDGATHSCALGARGLHDDDGVGTDIEGNGRRGSTRCEADASA
jgi:hypothetical protein